MTASAAETHDFQAEVSQVLRLVINSLYSNREIFLRELVSNASDALDKLRYRALTEPELRDDAPLQLVLRADGAARTLTVEDNGVGMTKAELIDNLGTVARSGSKAFIAALEQAKGGDIDLIGQFGVGFYSAYLVADRVEVVSRAAGSDEAWRWTSAADQTFTVEPAEREARGTTITLHLKEDAQDLTSPWKVRELVTRYSDYIRYPILVEMERYKDAEEGSDEAPGVEKHLEQVNKAVALWQRPKSEVTDEEYTEFYKHLTHDWEAPLAHTHFKVEGMQMFTSVLYVPRRPPFDLYAHEQKHGVRLHVKRVFIMDDCRELLPMFLRFVRGVVDSDDLPLNVSRELLQDSRIVKFIKKQLTKRILDMLEGLADEDADRYATLWEAYGAVIKEGLHSSPEHKDRLAKLVRYRSSKADGWTSLAEYRARMPEGQKAIYYIVGESERALRSSPHLEALAARGYEVLYMTDAIDEWAVEGLPEIDEMPLVSAMCEGLELEDAKPEQSEGDAEESGKDAADETLVDLRARFAAVLGDKVASVRTSSRLTTSPACLVVPEGGMHAHLERLMKQSQPGFTPSQRILELNPDHALIKHLETLNARDPESQRVGEWIEVIHDQALLTEGGRIDDPARFVQRVTELLEAAAGSAAADGGARATATATASA